MAYKQVGLSIPQPLRIVGSSLGVARNVEKRQISKPAPNCRLRQKHGSIDTYRTERKKLKNVQKPATPNDYLLPRPSHKEITFACSALDHCMPSSVTSARISAFSSASPSAFLCTICPGHLRTIPPCRTYSDISQPLNKATPNSIHTASRSE